MDRIELPETQDDGVARQRAKLKAARAAATRAKDPRRQLSVARRESLEAREAIADALGLR